MALLFGSQYRARSPLSGISQMNLNVIPNYWMISLAAMKYEKTSTSPKCTVVLTFSVMDGRKQKSDFNCAAPVSPGRKITVPCFLSVEEFKPGPSPSRMFLFAQRFEVFCDPAPVPSFLTANSLQRSRRGPRFNLVRLFPEKWEAGAGNALLQSFYLTL